MNWAAVFAMLLAASGKSFSVLAFYSNHQKYRQRLTDVVYRLTDQKRKTGSVALWTSQRGRKPVLTAEDKANLQRCMDENPDITIEEIREELHFSASYSTIFLNNSFLFFTTCFACFHLCLL
ncbi:MAG: hypothetical protein K2O45_03645 [Oscillospiraceae bacterium]|nr:hypothetical protein [Oscillospiraceae bacterium]